ncbi:MAG: hypothetical protein COU27_00395 [Candidatus Levybacteria bacterium CG10_big_fil_rev_8_21_14_0_10_36_7]|nr:MAG: hypothetical protein COU27_00395 [Candidatus Levybacteria bacterium CG10_big_fil_rev_8_21_14_0_10_36_7]
MIKDGLKQQYVRLNLGSGNDHREGWINVDSIGDLSPDLIADLSKKFPFLDNYADEILASDILEHFIKEKGEMFLRECHRVLKPNGVLTIRTHNLFQIFEQFKNDPQVLIHFIYGNTSDTSDFGAHKYAYTKKSITKLLKILGFEDINIQNETTNFLITAKKGLIREKKLNIGIIQQSPDIGGAETYMALLIKHIGNKAHIFFATDNNRFNNMVKKNVLKDYIIPFRLDIIGNKKGLIKSLILFLPTTAYYIYLLHAFKKEKIDVILMSGFSEKMLVTFLSLFFNIPVVWIEYGPLETIFSKNFMIPKIVYRLMNKITKSIIVPANNTKLDLIKNGKVSLDKIRIIPCGVEIINTNIKKENLAIDRKKNFIIGNVSRLALEKGQQYLIMAMKAVKKEIPNAKLFLIGDGPDKKRLEAMVKKEKLEESVILAGFVKSPDVFYSKMDVFIFPTVWELEGFGLVMAEAMAKKIPVIASNIGPIPEILSHDSGILVDPASPKSISNSIIKLYKNKNLRKNIATSGYERAKKKYNITTITTKYLSVLNESTL